MAGTPPCARCFSNRKREECSVTWREARGSVTHGSPSWSSVGGQVGGWAGGSGRGQPLMAARERLGLGYEPVLPWH